MARQRYVIMAFVIAGVLTGMVMQSAVVSLLAQVAMPDDRWLGGIASSSTLAGLVAGAVAFFALLGNKRAVSFTDEVIGELAKVTWPTRDEAVRATTTVVFTTLFVAALLGFYDLIWKNLADVVLFTEG